MNKINQNKTNLALNPVFDVVYKGKIFEIIKWEGKPGIMFEAAARSPGVRLLIELQKDGEMALLMSREFRREAGGVDFRLPGGKVFDTLEEYNQFRSGQDEMMKKAEEAAKKEGREEVGVSGGEYSLLKIAKAGASVEWDLYYFLVKNAVVGKQDLEAGEQGDIEPVILSMRDIFEKLVNGEIQEGRSAEVLWRWLVENKYLQKTP